MILQFDSASPDFSIVSAVLAKIPRPVCINSIFPPGLSYTPFGSDNPILHSFFRYQDSWENSRLYSIMRIFWPYFDFTDRSISWHLLGNAQVGHWWGKLPYWNSSSPASGVVIASTEKFAKLHGNVQKSRRNRQNRPHSNFRLRTVVSILVYDLKVRLIKVDHQCLAIVVQWVHF